MVAAADDRVFAGCGRVDDAKPIRSLILGAKLERLVDAVLARDEDRDVVGHIPVECADKVPRSGNGAQRLFLAPRARVIPVRGNPQHGMR